MVSNIAGNNQWKNLFVVGFNFRGFSEPQNPRKLELHD
jgi:hypothetical protein